MLLHTFKQARLGFRHGAVDFVRKKDICENGALDKTEFAFLHIKKVYADDIARKHIGNALNALEIERKRCRKGFCKHCFARAGDVVDKHMTAAKQGNYCKLGNTLLAHDNLAYVVHNGTMHFKDSIRFHKSTSVFLYLIIYFTIYIKICQQKRIPCGIL